MSTFKEEDIGILQKLKGNLRAIDQFRKLFNTLCPSCQIRVQQNPRMKKEEYCEKCQNKVEFRLNKIKELIR